ncbi:unnamed protein product [Lota lota]
MIVAVFRELALRGQRGSGNEARAAETVVMMMMSQSLFSISHHNVYCRNTSSYDWSCGVARGGDTGGSELLSPRLITDSPGTSGSEARHPPPVPPPPRASLPAAAVAQTTDPIVGMWLEDRANGGRGADQAIKLFGPFCSRGLSLRSSEKERNELTSQDPHTRPPVGLQISQLTRGVKTTRLPGDAVGEAGNHISPLRDKRPKKFSAKLLGRPRFTAQGVNDQEEEGGVQPL